MQGLHLTADLYDCNCAVACLCDATWLLARCMQAVSDVKLQAVAQLCHTFAATAQGPGGVTATVLLAESHLCLHTWPEQRAVTLDVYVCNFGGDHSDQAHSLMDGLCQMFEPAQVQRNSLWRGS